MTTITATGREIIAVKPLADWKRDLVGKLDDRMKKKIDILKQQIEGRLVFKEHPELKCCKPYNADAKTKTNEKMIEDLLEDIYDEVKAKWMPGQFSGRLDVPRIINMEAQAGEIWETSIFKQYEVSALDEIRMGVVIVLDTSTSMGVEAFEAGTGVTKTRLTLAKDACWALSTAFEKKGDNPVSIIVFNNGDESTKVSKKFGKVGSWDFQPTGYTDNFPAMIWAEGMLRELYHKEQLKNLFLILVTDGELDTEAEDKTKQMFARLKDNKKSDYEITTMEIHVAKESHFLGAIYQIYISDFSKFPRQFAEIMKRIQLELYKKLQR